jgi:hypothetical protein
MWLVTFCVPVQLAFFQVILPGSHAGSCLAQGEGSKVVLDPGTLDKVHKEAAKLRKAYQDAKPGEKKDVCSRVERDGVDFLLNDPAVKNGVISDGNVSYLAAAFVCMLGKEAHPANADGLEKTKPIPDDCICKLYKKLRSNPTARFATKSTEDWHEADKWAEEHCLEKKVPAPKETVPTVPKETGGGGKSELPKETGGGGAEKPKEDGPKAGLKGCPKGLKFIDDCVRYENISISLIGDGTSTSHCRLVLKSERTGVTTSADLETVCISRKTKHPPPTEEVAQEKKIKYKLGPEIPPNIAATLQAADEMEAQGKLDQVPIPLARRKATIAQLAIWQELGGTAAGEKDAINREAVKSDMLTKGGFTEKELTKQEDSKLNDKVDLICEAADLTCKLANQIPTEKIHKREVPQIGALPPPGEVPGSDNGPHNTPVDVPVPSPTETTEKQPGPVTEEPTPGKTIEESTPGKTSEESTLGKEFEEVCIPELTTFECEDKDYQTIAVVKRTTTHCPSETVGMPDGPTDVKEEPKKTTERKRPAPLFDEEGPKKKEEPKTTPKTLVKRSPDSLVQKYRQMNKNRTQYWHTRDKSEVKETAPGAIDDLIRMMDKDNVDSDSQEDIVAEALAGAGTAMSDADWIELYKRYRGPKGKFKDAKGKDWDKLDKELKDKEQKVRDAKKEADEKAKEQAKEKLNKSEGDNAPRPNF